MQKPSRLNRGLLIIFLAAAALVGTHRLDLLGHVVYAVERGRLHADFDHLQQIDQADVATLEEISHAYSVIAAAVKPSVVNIKAVSSNHELNRQLEEMLGEGRFQPQPSTGSGSGIIIDTEGHIVTNNHVVAGAEVIWATLADGRRRRAEIIGTDPMTDLAVIRINADRYHPARLGDSSRMKVGNVVLAIGSPFQLGHSVSHGIISAIGRSNVNVDIDYQDWLQTDAPINPGNSGGPLINTRGEVIGINTAIATESGVHQGVGFAIPSNVVSRITSQLKAGKTIVRGYLGVQIKQVDSMVADAFNLAEASGVLITTIGRDTPASRGGLKVEDIVMSVGGTPVQTREQLQSLIATTSPDTKVEMEIWRRGETIRLTIEIGRQPSGFSTSHNIRGLNPRNFGLPDKKNQHRPWRESNAEAETTGNKSHLFRSLGFEASTVSPELAKKFKPDKETQNGALITRVSPVSEAYAAKLRPGQVITGANGRRIRNLRELEQVLTAESIRSGVSLRVRTGEADFYTVLQVR